MRDAFAEAVISEASGPDCFFLTGDLGFMALENIRDVMKERFINCGVSEQNMISVAAGLAREGFRVFAYSIAPFCYARPFEQIRNDIMLQALPVCLVGNGGGYAYGHMGPTHHALEDCAVMTALGLHVIAPSFDEDIVPVLKNLWHRPTYLRLGYDVRPKRTTVSSYKPWRQIMKGEKGVLVVFGPLAGLAWNALMDIDPALRPALWALTELPITYIPEEMLSGLRETLSLVVLEEHLRQGGAGMQLLYTLANQGISLRSFEHRYALGYPSGQYGSQSFHRRECGLDQEAIRNLVMRGN